MSTRIILLTHPETNWNDIGRYQGHLDVPLNSHGRSNALICGHYLSTQHINAVYSSDLYRAFETARIIADQCSLTEVITNNRLREGRWEKQDGLYEYPLLSFYTEQETGREVARRMNDILREIATRYDGKIIVVVSHCGSVRFFIEWLLEQSTDLSMTYENEQTALNILCLTNGKWHIEYLNDLSYINSI